MDNSFILFSSMSPKIGNGMKQGSLSKKVPTVLALKKNIRRSSMIDSLPISTSNNSLVLVESSTTDTTDSSSVHTSSDVGDAGPIVISDSDSSKENAHKSTSCSQRKSNQNDCVLSVSKLVAINKWISDVNLENKSKPSSSLNDDTSKHKKELIKNGLKTTVADEFDECLSRLIGKFNNGTGCHANTSDDLHLSFNDLHINRTENYKVNHHLNAKQKSSVNKYSSMPSDSNADVISEKKDPIEFKSDILPAQVSSDDRCVDLCDTLSSDVLAESNNSDDSSSESGESVLDELYGNNWRSAKKKIMPKSEPRPKKKIERDPKIVSKTEGKRKPKSSLIYKNPYLQDNELPIQTPADTPWRKRLETLCDSDSSTQSLKNVTSKARVRLPFSNDETDSDDDLSTWCKKYDLNTKPTASIHELYKNTDVKALVSSDKENLSDFSENDEPLEDRVRRKLGLDKKYVGSAKKENDKLKRMIEKKTESDIQINQNIFPSTADKADTAGITFPVKTKTDIRAKKKNLLNTNNVVLKNIAINSKVKDMRDQKSIVSKELFKTCASDNVHLSFLASLSGNAKISQCDPAARLFRNNFQSYKVELATRLFKLYNENVFNNAIASDTPIEWNCRMTGTAGYCFCKKITRSTGLIERKARIVLSAKVLDSADRLRDTLIHEMCHAATWIVNHVSNGHCSFWKAWARKAMQTFPELPPIKRCHEYVINTKYTYKCTDCGYSIGRHSKSLDIEKKRCGYCYGKFELLINKTFKNGETKSVPVTPRKEPSAFALFVKENYATFKTPQLNHGQVMKLLGEKFYELKVSVCKE